MSGCGVAEGDPPLGGRQPGPLPPHWRSADFGDPGQGTGQLRGTGLAEVLLAGGGVGGEFGLDCAQQPHFHRDLSGQFRERHGRVIAIQAEGRRRGGPPLQGAFFALLVPGGAG